MPNRAQSIVESVLEDLQGRRGIRQEFDAIDDEVMVELRATLLQIVRDILINGQRPSCVECGRQMKRQPGDGSFKCCGRYVVAAADGGTVPVEDTKTVRVRIAVAVTPSGAWSSAGNDLLGTGPGLDIGALDMAGVYLKKRHRGVQTVFIEADVPVPDEPTEAPAIEAKVVS